MRLVSSNVGGGDLWSAVRELDADVALLQEAPPPPASCADAVVPVDWRSWQTAGWTRRPWRAALARLSDRVRLDPRPTSAIESARSAADWIVSCQGTLAAADVQLDGRTVFAAVSAYAQWQSAIGRRLIYADASAHRILSDLSALISSRDPRLIVAGDWNILFGYGEHGNSYWRHRYQTVFDRAEALGLRFVGPQHPDGRQAEP